MSEIFISYSRKDSVVADELVGRLEQSGKRVWIDRHKIDAGTQWRRELADAIRQCRVFIVLLSSASIRSKIVATELTLADENGKAIIPIDLEPVSIPDHLEVALAGRHRLALSEGFDAGIAKLLEALVGAEERAFAAASRFDATLPDEVAEVTGLGWDTAELDAKRRHLMDELAALDRDDAANRASNDATVRQRAEILRKLDAIMAVQQDKLDGLARGMFDHHLKIAARWKK